MCFLALDVITLIILFDDYVGRDVSSFSLLAIFGFSSTEKSWININTDAGLHVVIEFVRGTYTHNNPVCVCAYSKVYSSLIDSYLSRTH